MFTSASKGSYYYLHWEIWDQKKKKKEELDQGHTANDKVEMVAWLFLTINKIGLYTSLKRSDFYKALKTWDALDISAGSLIE